MQPHVYLAAVGDANSPVTWSGIPFYLLRAGRARALFTEGLALSTTAAVWNRRRILWNATSMLSGDRPGGYQYSPSFLEKLWAPVTSKIQDGVVVNCFQLFPPSLVANQKVEKWFFIDQTLLQLFDQYGLRQSVGRHIAHQAIERERVGYQAARGIVVHSRWAAQSVIADYQISADRVHVVVPGAGLDPVEYELWEGAQAEKRNSFDADKPLQMVFVGKEWQRKGLDRLLRALRLARSSGTRLSLKVIGCRPETLPEDLRAIDGVEWLGFIDKQAEAKRFLRTVAECDIGCLLSRAEAGGIAIREYHALGLPVIGTDVGGAPEHMIDGASLTISTQATDEELAAKLASLQQQPSRLKKLREVAWLKRRTALWDASLDTLARFWPHRLDPQLDVNLLNDHTPPASRTLRARSVGIR